MTDTLDNLINLAKQYYRMPDNGAGGNLHIVLDDGNIEDDNIQFCLEQALKEGDAASVALAKLLLSVPEEMREALYNSYGAYCL